MTSWLGTVVPVDSVAILLSGTTITTISSWNGDGTTYQTFFTSPLLPAGTYKVGVDFYASPNGTAWSVGDAIASRIVANSDTATSYIYPGTQTRPYYTGFQLGTSPFTSGQTTSPCSGVVILRTDGYIYYQATLFNTAGTATHSLSMEQATYQRIA